ncbi:MAG: cytochrome c biogenesis protein CcdA [Candidatus Nanopelagicales bacterium]
MLVILGALLAGVLTTLAPCVLPMLPVIVGSSIVGTSGGKGAGGGGGRSGGGTGGPSGPGGGGPSGGATTDTGSSGGSPDHATGGSSVVGTETGTRTITDDAIDPAVARRLARRRAYVITASLGASLAIFTLLLKATTAFIDIPAELWAGIAGGILILLGLTGLFPAAWDKVSATLSLQSRSTGRLAAARQRDGLTGQVLTGAALGPVFSSCSPLYGYVIVTVLPADFWYGMVLLAAYLVGLCGTLLAISLAGQRLVRNVRWLADPHGWFRRVLGGAFVLIGIAIITGFDKTIQTWVLENSPIAPWNLDSGFIPQE